MTEAVASHLHEITKNRQHSRELPTWLCDKFVSLLVSGQSQLKKYTFIINIATALYINNPLIIMRET